MTDETQQAPAPSTRDQRRDAKADIAAAKARAKAERPWYKKKRYLGPLGLLLLIVIVSVASSDGGDGEELAGEPASEEATDSSADAEAADAPERSGMGEPVQDGKFTFTANSLDCGQKTVGEGPLSEEAQGQWCVLAITVANHGDEAQHLSASDQLVYDEQDREFSAEFMPFAADSPIFEGVNPGNTIEGHVYFDVPEGVQPVTAELHDSPFSSGVRVDLR